ncbi:MAG: GNAT family N-acetyltransferase [Candidatus Acidiferrales bacterium]
MKIVPVVLEGRHVQLEPMTNAHHAELCEVGLDEDLWKWIPQPVCTHQDMRAYIEKALAEQSAGSALPFVTIERNLNRGVGSTRYGNIDTANHRLEIGWTWIAKAWQRTAVNTEAKYLMLRHAFETYKCIRVEFKTDSLNQKSRDALRRIGAVEEGIFRNHMMTSTGRLRHSVYFSIVESEWPSVKNRLEEKLARTEPAKNPL